MIRDLVIDGGDVAFTVELTTPACPLKDQIEGDIRQALTPLGVESLALGWSRTVRRAAPRTAEQLVPGREERHRGRSGKGGVGKSTVSATSPSRSPGGRHVGLLDADIYGPNIPMMLGLEGQPRASETARSSRSSATA